jgi:hypothetical protein
MRGAAGNEQAAVPEPTRKCPYKTLTILNTVVDQDQYMTHVGLTVGDVEPFLTQKSGTSNQNTSLYGSLSRKMAMTTSLDLKLRC